MITTLKEVKEKNKIYFGEGQQEFFNDVSYEILHSKQGTPFLVTLTSGFTDMFDGEVRFFFSVKPIDKNLVIEPKSTQFKTYEEVKKWLKGDTTKFPNIVITDR